MSDIAVQISESQAKYLAVNGLDAFVNNTPNPDNYYTYPDVAGSNFAHGTYGSPFVMPSSINVLTGKLTWDAVGGTYPVIKSRKMFPR